MRRLLLALSALAVSTGSTAQIYDRLFQDDYQIDTTRTRTLGLELDATAAFRDNEYTTPLTTGYTLPACILAPRLTYDPIRQIHMEVGARAIFFAGANKYPSWAYHDIVHWKGNQYQHGFHILPWLRLQAGFFQDSRTGKSLNIVLGNIYGGQNHKLNDALWNPETDIIQDPEMGLQILWDRKHLHMDTWVNWQSFIYKLDTHQEAFTVGSSWIVKPGNSPRYQWSIPVQIVGQHRGGEHLQGNVGSVQTMWNASVGGTLRINDNYKVLKWQNYEINTIATWQQAGRLWNHRNGFAIHVAAEWCLWNDFGIRTGYLCAPRHFVSLYGNSLFNTQSIIPDVVTAPQDAGATATVYQSFHGNNTVYAHVSYSHCFARHYTLGADVNAYYTRLGASSHTGHGDSRFNLNFGICLRVDPTIILKRFNKNKTT